MRGVLAYRNIMTSAYPIYVVTELGKEESMRFMLSRIPSIVLYESIIFILFIYELTGKMYIYFYSKITEKYKFKKRKIKKKLIFNVFLTCRLFSN